MASDLERIATLETEVKNLSQKLSDFIVDTYKEDARDFRRILNEINNSLPSIRAAVNIANEKNLEQDVSIKEHDKLINDHDDKIAALEKINTDLEVYQTRLSNVEKIIQNILLSTKALKAIATFIGLGSLGGVIILFKLLSDLIQTL